MPDLAFLSRRFALSSCLALHFCRGVLPSAYARPRISVAAFCPRHMPDLAFLSQRFAFGICSTSRFCRGVLPSAYACYCVSVAAFCPQFMPSFAFLSQRFTLGICPTSHFCRGVLPSVHACCLPHGDKQDGLRYASFLFRRSRSPFVRSRGVGAVICPGGFTSGLGVSLWRSRRSCRGTGTELRGERDWRRGACALLRNRIGLAMLSAGSTLGLRAPDCAKESSTLWTLLTLRRG